MHFEIQNVRTGFPKLKAIFDVAFGEKAGTKFVPLFVVRDFRLMTSKTGDYFFLGPSKDREKNGEKVIGPRGYPVRDEFFEPVWAGSQGSREITAESLEFKELILASAVDAYQSASENPQPKRSSTPRKAESVSASTGSRSSGSPLDADEDDDLPF